MTGLLPYLVRVQFTRLVNQNPEPETSRNVERGTVEPRGEYAKGPALPCGEVDWTCVSRWNRSGAAL